MTTETYRLKEAEAQRRLDSLAASDNIADTRQEIALLRWMIEEAISAKNYLFANSLIATLDRACRSHEASLFRRNEVLEKGVARRLAAALVSAVIEHFSGSCEDWEERIDRAREQMLTAISAAKNNNMETS